MSPLLTYVVIPLAFALLLLAPLVVSEEGGRRRARRDARVSRLALMRTSDDVAFLLARGDVASRLLAPLVRGEVYDLAHARDLACDALVLLTSSRDEVLS
jgi:hypothetical protein